MAERRSEWIEPSGGSLVTDVKSNHHLTRSFKFTTDCAHTHTSCSADTPTRNASTSARTSATARSIDTASSTDKANALQRVYATKRRRELHQAKLHPLQTPATTTPSLAISQDTIKQEHKYVLDSPVGVDEWTPIEFWSPTRPDLSEEEYAYMYLNLVLMSS
ncbi:unnamed protein product [Aphanomyces euteiches]